jgi:hypothetical protein
MRILENNLSVFKLSLFILFSCLSIGCYGWYKLSAFDASVDKLIEKTCSPDAQCEIRIANATDFDWDEMFVFRSGLTNADVEHILPAARGFRGEFNDKVAFFNNGKLVRLVEEPEVIEGEYFPDGTILFQEGEETWEALRYQQNAMFRVTPIKLSRGIGYRLVCSNCHDSSIFRRFAD